MHKLLLIISEVYVPQSPQIHKIFWHCYKKLCGDWYFIIVKKQTKPKNKQPFFHLYTRVVREISDKQALQPRYACHTYQKIYQTQTVVVMSTYRIKL